MGKTIRCKGCYRIVPANPRLKNNEQRYCGETLCQSIRKAEWEKAKIAKDPGYKTKRDQTKSKYEKKNPGRSSQYRASNPKSHERNLLLQSKRDQKRRELKAREDDKNRELSTTDASCEKSVVNTDGFEITSPDLATTDALRNEIVIKPGVYEISAKKCDLATTDALKDKFLIIPVEYINLATTDAFDFRKNSVYPPDQTIIQKEVGNENRKKPHQTGSDP
jgi:hypothetical protein